MSQKMQLEQQREQMKLIQGQQSHKLGLAQDQESAANEAAIQASQLQQAQQTHEQGLSQSDDQHAQDMEHQGDKGMLGLLQSGDQNWQKIQHQRALTALAGKQPHVNKSKPKAR
jgi:hypothetical protein